MCLTPIQTVVIILSVALGTIVTRFAPFVLFPEKQQPPQIITYLGQLLPPAMMGLLVVYCLKNVSITTAPHGIPEFISMAVIVVLHIWKRNVLLSIGVGTVLYMVLVQFVFGLPSI